MTGERKDQNSKAMWRKLMLHEKPWIAEQLIIINDLEICYQNSELLSKHKSIRNKTMV